MGGDFGKMMSYLCISWGKGGVGVPSDNLGGGGVIYATPSFSGRPAPNLAIYKVMHWGKVGLGALIMPRRD